MHKCQIDNILRQLLTANIEYQKKNFTKKLTIYTQFNKYQNFNYSIVSQLKNTTT